MSLDLVCLGIRELNRVIAFQSNAHLRQSSHSSTGIDPFAEARSTVLRTEEDSTLSLEIISLSRVKEPRGVSYLST